MGRACHLLQQDLGGAEGRPFTNLISFRITLNSTFSFKSWATLRGVALIATLLALATSCPTASSAQPASNNPSQSFAVALPELEGPVTMGIFSSEGKLVRLLYQDAAVDSIPAGLNGLIMTWDGKDDLGRDVPAGTYMARGLVHGPILISSLPVNDDTWRPSLLMQTEEPQNEGLPKSSKLVPSDPLPKNRIWVRTPKDELLETRPWLAVSAKREGSDCLITVNGIPLVTLPMENSPSVTSLSLLKGNAQGAAGSADLLIERGPLLEKYTLSGLHRMVPLNAGALKIAPDAFHLMPGAGESAP